MKRRLAILSDICEINPPVQVNLSPEDFCSFVPMESVDDFSGRIERTYVRPIREVAKGYTPFAEDDVIVAKITPCMEKGKAAIARNLRNGIGFGSTEFHVLRKSDAVIPQWLYYFWRYPRTRINAEKTMRGSAGQKRVPADFLESLEIPLPDLAEQKRIAAILDRADRLRRLRRYGLEMAETLLPVAFLELFGARFHKGPLLPLIDLVKITGGGTPSRDCPEYFRGRIPWLTSKDMRGDYIWDTEEHITQEAIENSCTNLAPADSILLVVKSKVLMHRLPVAIARVPICHGQDIKSVQCSKELHPEFARFVLKYYEPRLLQIARGANTEGLTLPMLQELPVPKVDLVEQKKFAGLVTRVERMRSGHRESLRQAEHLFQTLLHRAFTVGL